MIPKETYSNQKCVEQDTHRKYDSVDKLTKKKIRLHKENSDLSSFQTQAHLAVMTAYQPPPLTSHPPLCSLQCKLQGTWSPSPVPPPPPHHSLVSTSWHFAALPSNLPFSMLTFPHRALHGVWQQPQGTVPAQQIEHPGCCPYEAEEC